MSPFIRVYLLRLRTPLSPPRDHPPAHRQVDQAPVGNRGGTEGTGPRRSILIIDHASTNSTEQDYSSAKCQGKVNSRIYRVFIGRAIPRPAAGDFGLSRGGRRTYSAQVFGVSARLLDGLPGGFPREAAGRGQMV